MSGIGRGRGHGIGHGIGKGSQYRVGNPYVTNKKKKIFCAALGESLFTFNDKEAADQMWTTAKKIVKHTETIYGQDISN